MIRLARAATSRPAVMAAIALLCVTAAAQAKPRRPSTMRRAAGMAGMAIIPSGAYRPLYADGDRTVPVRSFALDRSLVTREQFLEFVRSNPRWRRGAIASALADGEYLADWRGALDPGASSALRQPVVAVSWFAAKAYCEAHGKRLPTTAEWEYVAAASETKRDATGDAAFQRRLVGLYSSRSSGITNVYGVSAMHGPVWEWTLDFKGASAAGHAHHMSGMEDPREHRAGCASAAIGAQRGTDYAAFLRDAMRAGLTRRTTFEGLGFRCAASVGA